MVPRLPEHVFLRARSMVPAWQEHAFSVLGARFRLGRNMLWSPLGKGARARAMVPAWQEHAFRVLEIWFTLGRSMFPVYKEHGFRSAGACFRRMVFAWQEHAFSG